MQKITNSSGLTDAIIQLEHQQSLELRLLKVQFRTTYEGLKPINIIKNTIKDALSTPDLKTKVVNAAIGVTTGFIAKKLVVGGSDNPFKKILGTLVEIIVAAKVTKNAEGIKSAAGTVLEKIVPKQTEQ